MIIQECGSNYTAKLEGMFQDIELSRECQAAFSAHLAKQSQPPSTALTVTGAGASSSSGGSGGSAGAVVTSSGGVAMSGTSCLLLLLMRLVVLVADDESALVKSGCLRVTSFSALTYVSFCPPLLHIDVLFIL
jgi:hypothetical protein